MSKARELLSIFEMVRSENKGAGFFNTVMMNYGSSESDTEKLFDYAASLIGSEGKEFLDSVQGRHFADLLSFHGAEEKSPLKVLKDAIKNAFNDKKKMQGNGGLLSMFNKEKV